MSSPIAEPRPCGSKNLNSHAREEPGRPRPANPSPSAVRMRRLRDRRARGVVHVAKIEIVESDVPLLIQAGYLAPDGTCVAAALSEALEAVVDAWIDQQTSERSDA